MTVFCSHFTQSSCRSCEWMELDYPAQLLKKEEQLRHSLEFFSPFALEPTVRSKRQGFRNRAKMSVTGTVEQPVIGLLGEDVLDAGRELLNCPIHHPKLNELLVALPELIRKYKLIPYNIASRKGELKALIAYYSPGPENQSGQFYLRFVLRSKECVSRLRKALPELQSRIPELVCISANIQPVPHAILEGPEEILITERATIDYWLGALKLRLAPQAFVQTNQEVAVELYQTAARWIGEAQQGRRGKCLELYCGQGAFSFAAANMAEEFLGIEINPEAVRNANAQAAELGLGHLKFICADATQVEAELQAHRPELVLVNPPRKGLGGAVELLLRNPPEQLLYSSCNVDTLASDLRILATGYRLRRAQIFDMFPHTEHFETLVW
ncbi:MAG: 23S rRNA (uracil-5-)-methyltransferase RumA, partial [Bdellovibrionales bacterium GWC1_52_8]